MSQQAEAKDAVGHLWLAQRMAEVPAGQHLREHLYHLWECVLGEHALQSHLLYLSLIPVTRDMRIYRRMRDQ